MTKARDNKKNRNWKEMIQEDKDLLKNKHRNYQNFQQINFNVYN